MKKNKTVTFQTKDAHESRLYSKAQKEHNFSGLMKRLYSEHLDEQERTTQQQGPQRQQVERPQHIKGSGGIKIDLRQQQGRSN